MPIAFRRGNRFPNLVGRTALALVALTGGLPRAAHGQMWQPPEGRSIPEEVARDLVGGAVGLASDTWDHLVSPFQIGRDDLGTVAWVLGGGALLFATDEGVTEAALRNRDVEPLETVVDIGHELDPFGLMSQTNPYYVGGIVIGYATGFDRLFHFSQEMLFSHWIAGLSRNTLKHVVGRRRPDQQEILDPYVFSFNGGTSFPSGHASSIFQLAAVLSHHADWWPASALFYAAAGTVAYERVANRKHWPSDVWFGALWGYGTTKIVIEGYHDRHDAEEPLRTEDPGALAGARVVPWTPAGGGAGFAVSLPVGGADR